MTGPVVIAIYKPDAGKEAEFMDLVRQHPGILKAEGLAGTRTPLVLQTDDGTVLEIFDWIDEDAAGKAHLSEAVQSLWAAMGEIGSFPAGKDVAAFQGTFPHFKIAD
jgi:hypothetical protein